MTRKQRRLTMVGACGAILAVATVLVLVALNDQIVFFYSPTDLTAQAMTAGTRVRLGGLVEQGSVARGDDGAVSFAITDTANRIIVTFRGLLPDLFREGQGIVAEGVMAADGTVTAETVLAKHDENYLPKEVVDALKAQGVWQEGGAPQ